MINRLISFLSPVSKPGLSQEVQIWQITISVSWQRQETRLATIAVKVCTQGLYAHIASVKTGFAAKVKGGIYKPLSFWIITLSPMYGLSTFSLVKWKGAFECVHHRLLYILVVVYCEFIQVCCLVCCCRIWNRSKWNRGPPLSAPGLPKQEKKKSRPLRRRWIGESSDESCGSFTFKETI